MLFVVIGGPGGKQEASKPCRKKSAILLVLVVVLNILETRSQQTMLKKQPHLVSASCRAQHPGKQEASKHCKKQPHFVSASCRAQHPGKQEASKPCRKNSPILLALVVVLNILETKGCPPNGYCVK